MERDKDETRGRSEDSYGRGLFVPIPRAIGFIIGHMFSNRLDLASSMRHEVG